MPRDLPCRTTQSSRPASVPPPEAVSLRLGVGRRERLHLRRREGRAGLRAAGPGRVEDCRPADLRPAPGSCRRFRPSITVATSGRSSASSISCTRPSTRAAASSRPTPRSTSSASCSSSRSTSRRRPATCSRAARRRASGSPTSTRLTTCGRQEGRGHPAQGRLPRNQ